MAEAAAGQCQPAICDECGRATLGLSLLRQGIHTRRPAGANSLRLSACIYMYVARAQDVETGQWHPGGTHVPRALSTVNLCAVCCVLAVLPAPDRNVLLLDEESFAARWTFDYPQWQCGSSSAIQVDWIVDHSTVALSVQEDRLGQEKTRLHPNQTHGAICESI